MEPAANHDNLQRGEWGCAVEAEVSLQRVADPDSVGAN